MSIAPQYRTGTDRFFAGILDGMVLRLLSVLTNFQIETEWESLFAGILESFLAIGYSVFFHYKFGQTLGKMAMKVKVIDASETKGITFRQSFLRESVWIFFTVLAYSYLAIRIATNSDYLADETQILLALLPVAWFILEIVSMLTNDRRRAVHDMIAGTVVVKHYPIRVGR
ncbi:MAG: RDD family protein [Gemmatimonadaceae bacterium]|nr:RDD family protein [Chitinophagaceae bacterium]